MFELTGLQNMIGNFLQGLLRAVDIGFKILIWYLGIESFVTSDSKVAEQKKSNNSNNEEMLLIAHYLLHSQPGDSRMHLLTCDGK